MRFRKLSLQELEELKDEFIQFLASNTVTAQDWENLKETNNEKAEQLIEIFSDEVLDKALTNIKFLEKREPKNLLVFHCRKDEIDMIGLSIDNNSELDFTNENHFTEIASNVKINIFKSSKDYNKNREDEIFEMLESGCLTTDEKLYKTLVNLK